jgi:hypothetical protein
VAIGASNNAFMPLNLGLDRFNRLELVDVRCLAFHVVNVQSRVMDAVAAVNASCARLEVRKPLLYELATLVGGHIHALPVSRLLESVFAPRLALLGGRMRSLGPRAIGAQRRAVLGAISLGDKRLTTNHADPLSGGRIFPGRHKSMILTLDILYPCKPDIFDATYEAEWEAGR